MTEENYKYICYGCERANPRWFMNYLELCPICKLKKLLFTGFNNLYKKEPLLFYWIILSFVWLGWMWYVLTKQVLNIL